MYHILDQMSKQIGPLNPKQLYLITNSVHQWRLFQEFFKQVQGKFERPTEGHVETGRGFQIIKWLAYHPPTRKTRKT